MLKKKSFRFAALLLILFALLTFQSIKGKSPFINFAIYPLKVLEEGGTIIIRSVKNLFRTYVLLVNREAEVQRLTALLELSEQEENTCIEARQENLRLREILDLKSRRRDYLTTARVFATDPTNWFQMLWINRGTSAGVERRMVALTPLGTVGTVHKALAGKSSIMLITDVNSTVAVRLQSSRIAGILEGKGDGRCLLKYIPGDAEVAPGERVVTSGLDGIYPEGLLIGYVNDVSAGESDFFLQIEVVPSQDLNRVEKVVILKK